MDLDLSKYKATLSCKNTVIFLYSTPNLVLVIHCLLKWPKFAKCSIVIALCGKALYLKSHERVLLEEAVVAVCKIN